VQQFNASLTSAFNVGWVQKAKNSFILLHSFSGFLAFLFSNSTIASPSLLYKFPHSSVIFMASAKANMKTTTCLLTKDELKDLCERYDLFPEYGSELPSPTQTAIDAPPRKITLYTNFCTSSHLRIQIRHFLADLLCHYGVHLSQVAPLGLPKVFHYEFCVRALKSAPEIPMFCPFYKLFKAGIDLLLARETNFPTT
jgi:hypothetical protein